MFTTFKNFWLKLTKSTTFQVFKVDIRLWWIIIIVNVLITTISMISMFYSFYLRNLDLPYEYSIYFFIDCLLGIIFMGFIAFHTQRELQKGTSWWLILLFHFFLAFLVSLGMRTGLEIHHMFNISNSLEGFSLEFLLDRYILQLSNNFLRYFIVLFIVYSFVYFQLIEGVETRHKNLENQLLTTRLNLLKSQVHPHFLFNSLNTVVSLIKSDPEKASIMIVDLSDFLRQTLNLKEVQTITVSEELRILKKYLNILKVRFGNQITIKQNIQPQVLEKKIPPLLLQPIIENSIKHGFYPDINSLEIEVNISLREENFVDIEIINNGRPIEDSDNLFNNGVGLKNIKSRLSTHYGGSSYFQIDNLPFNLGVRNYLRIPTTKK